MAIIKPLQSITLKNDNGEDTTYVVASAPAIVETTEPADVASFSDGAEGIPVSSLIADINPVQNLNGQSAPYPAGGGKNKLPSGKLQATSTQVRIGIDESNNWYHHLDAGTYTLSYTTNVTVTAYYTKSGGSAVNVSDNGGTFTLSEAGDYGFHLYKQGGLSINDVLTFQLETGSTATAYAPYSNICPITGWTGMQASRTGKNILDPSIIEQGTFDAIGPNNVNTGYISVKPNTTYTVSVGLSVDGTYIRECLKDKSTATIKQAYSRRFTFTTDANTYYVRIMWYVAAGISAETVKDNEPQFEFGSTATTYEPYNGTTYPISWEDKAGTVYGGTLDVTNGKLIATVEYKAMTGNLFTGWVGTGTVKRAYTGEEYNNVSILMCDSLAVSDDYGTVNHIGKQSAGARIFVSPSWAQSCADLTQFKTALASNPINAIVTLATPIEYDIDPEAILTILGTNNIWADTGDVEVSYVADTKLYIDSKL